MQIQLDRLEKMIDDVREQFQREEDQAILQRNMDKAIHALAGKDACARLKNSLGMGAAMDANWAAVTAAKKRA